jgi:hypothetical protein
MKFSALAAACGALALGTGAVAQSYGQPVDLARFDARATPDVAAKLAICDAARFLRNGPDLTAHSVYVRRDDGRLDLLLGPYFVGGPEWYDEDLEHAYRRLRRQGTVSFEQVSAARNAIGRDMVRTFGRANGPEQRFLEDQSRYCETVEDAGRI